MPLEGEAEASKTLASTCSGTRFSEHFNQLHSNTGANDGTITTEQTYDRVESTNAKDTDIKAARC